MILDRLPDYVIVTEPGERLDAYGNAVEDWDSQAVTYSGEGWLRPVGATEVEGQARSPLETTYRLDLPDGAPISARSRVTRGTEVYSVTGRPHVIRGLSGRLDRVRASLTWQEG